MNRQALNSAIYTGRVRHRRHAPVPHAFSLPLMMVYLDLSELDRVFAGRWLWSTRRPTLAWLRRRDYLDPEVPDLDEAVRRRVMSQTGRRPDGPVRMLTHLRTWGYCFNPITIYYCFEADGRTLDTVLAAITNTPWGERHTYVLPADTASRRGAWHEFGFGKRFHVSPFMPMALDYRWRFRPPGESLAVNMSVLRDGDEIFDATLAMNRHPITASTLARALVRYPAMPIQVIAAIHWQALRLWLKRVPFYPHPDKSGSAANKE